MITSSSSPHCLDVLPPNFADSWGKTKHHSTVHHSTQPHDIVHNSTKPNEDTNT